MRKITRISGPYMVSVFAGILRRFLSANPSEEIPEIFRVEEESVFTRKFT
jgi:hypothetical protein